MKNYFAYIRVSTIKQGEKGSSLQEQRAAIEYYAAKHRLSIFAWFEEQETAAKQGRTVFRRMLYELKKGRVSGLIIHKVDRSARNLSDWAELGALMDSGIDVHFAHEGLDLTSRGGRLSADIQAVVAADFIRNLRDEVKKGLYGRIRQGIYPFKAPVGYQNNGKGQLKTIEPVQGNLVRQAFELYATGEFGLHRLRAEMTERGLRNQNGLPFYTGSLGKLLRNRFYYGAMEIKGVVYEGKHQPLISKALYDTCRAHAEGRLVSATRVWRGKSYRYRGLVACKSCRSRMTVETQGGFAYYRCRHSNCRGVCINEEYITLELNRALSYLPTPPMLTSFLFEAFEIAESQKHAFTKNIVEMLQLQLKQNESREERLIDALIDGTIEKKSYETKKNVLLNERISIGEQLKDLKYENFARESMEKFAEVIKSLQNMAYFKNEANTNEIMKIASPKILISGKTVEIQWSKAIAMLLDVGGYSYCADKRIAHLKRIQSVISEDTFENKERGLDNSTLQVTPHENLSLSDKDQKFRQIVLEQANVLYDAITNLTSK